MKVTIDFETANINPDVDLPVMGAEAYAAHPQTEILCLVAKYQQERLPLAVGDDGRRRVVWKPGDGNATLEALASDPTVTFEAHNAVFEQMIWWYIMVQRYGLPPIPIRRWSCSQAAALYRGLPGKLEAGAVVLQLQSQKDMEGSKLTISLSRPMPKTAHMAAYPGKEHGTKKAWGEAFAERYDRSPATIQRVVDYCDQDVTVEEELSMRVGSLSAYERVMWEHDQIIQQRGVLIDKPLVEACIKITRDASYDLLTKFMMLTGGLRPGQVEAVRQWIESHGITMPDVTAARVEALLGGKLEEDDEDAETSMVSRDRGLPPAVLEVLQIRQLLGASAIKKFPRMLQVLGPDGRVRFLTQYHGAHTGRGAGRLFQPQNFPRLSVMDPRRPTEPLDPELVASALLSADHQFAGDFLGLHPLKACSRALRHAIIAGPGNKLCVGDFAGVEMRVVLALAGQLDKCKLLAEGLEIYLDMAEDIYHRPKGEWTPNDKALLKKIKEERVVERTIGKNTVLGCGFGMGHGTFRERYAKDRPLDVLDAFGNPASQFCLDIIKAYRNDWAPKVPQLWKALNEIACEAVITGRARTAYGIEYSVEGAWLKCGLPDGQIMWYYDPRPCAGRFGGDSFSYGVWNEGQWKRVQAYGGLLTENVVQKLARGLLMEAMLRSERAGFPVILSVHDEIVSEAPLSADQKAFEQIMREAPPWARNMGIPIGVEGGEGHRYRKF